VADLLVTGAAGFIGSALARALLAQGHTVATIDNLTTGRRVNVPAACDFIEGDVADPASTRALGGRRFDAIFHLAGQSGGIRSFRDPFYDLAANVTSTLRVLEYAREVGTPSVVYASSMSVYGDPHVLPVRESDPVEPKSPYGVGKLASEHYLRLYAEDGPAGTALRLNNVYGAGQDLLDFDQGMASIFLGQAIADRRIVVKGPRDRFRDFVHVSDVVEAFIRAWSIPGADRFRIYNVATGRKTHVSELLDLIRGALPFDVAVEFAGETPGDQFGIFSSFDRIKDELGWIPKFSVEDGIKGMVDWATSRSP
jgi:UDP-glucose 4-epimerase